MSDPNRFIKAAAAGMGNLPIGGYDHGHDDHAEETSTVFNWAVVTDEGLTLYVHLTKDEAEACALDRRQRDKTSWAVPMEDAAELQAAWTRLGEESAATLRLTRMQNVTRHLRGMEV